jgi:hypothetical protein
MDFGQAIIKNGADAVGRFLTDGWIIIDPDGGVIDKARFLDVIRSGALTREQMDSDALRVRIYGDTVVATALPGTKGKFIPQERPPALLDPFTGEADPQYRDLR